MKTQLTIQYARCIKFTPGQPDQAPHSAYRATPAFVHLLASPERDGFTDWTVLRDGETIGEGQTSAEAIADAQYTLMANSRHALENGLIAL